MVVCAPTPIAENLTAEAPHSVYGQTKVVCEQMSGGLWPRVGPAGRSVLSGISTQLALIHLA
jgi:hypothetical protein